jgi:hypothetical protein
LSAGTISDDDADEVCDESADTLPRCEHDESVCGAAHDADAADESSSVDAVESESGLWLERGESVNDRMSLVSVIGDAQEGEGEGRGESSVGDDERMAWTAGAIDEALDDDDPIIDRPSSSREPNVASMMSEAWLSVSRH